MQVRSIQNVAFFSVFGLIAWLAYANYLIQDDGFISMTYANNWAHGFGPVWYPGSREFGYTNFLYVALVAGLSALGLDTLNAAAFIGYAAFGGSAILVFKLVKLLTKSDFAALSCVLIIFTNYVVSSFAHGLLECSLQIFWVTCTYYLAFRYVERRTSVLAIALSLAASLSLLTRLDSALLVFPVAIYLLIKIRWHRHLAIFAVIPLVAVGGFLIWCQFFYGSFLPNSFHAKAQGLRIPYGFWYLHSFFGNELYIYPISALLAAFVLFYRTSGKFRDSNSNSEILTVILPCVFWLLYVFYIGGDFISFRVMIPFIVFFFIFIVTTLYINGAKRILVGLLAYSFVVSTSHWIIDKQNPQFYSRGQGVDSPRALKNYVTRPEIGWQHTGAVLGKLFYTGSASDPVISVIAAGAIPFQSRLHAIDMHGLNDIWVAIHGKKFSNRPGHFRMATREYLESRNVNLIIGPHYSCSKELFPVKESLTEEFGELPIILVPVSPNCRMTALYLHQHSKIEEHLRKGTIFKQDANVSR